MMEALVCLCSTCKLFCIEIAFVSLDTCFDVIVYMPLTDLEGLKLSRIA